MDPTARSIRLHGSMRRMPSRITSGVLSLSVIGSPGSPAFREVIEALRPLERAVDDLLRVVHDGLDQLAGVERAGSTSIVPRRMPLPMARLGVDVLVERDASPPEEQLAQPVVPRGGEGEDEAAVLHPHALLHPHVVEGEEAGPVAGVDLAHEVGELVIGEPARGPGDDTRSRRAGGCGRCRGRRHPCRRDRGRSGSGWGNGGLAHRGAGLGGQAAAPAWAAAARAASTRPRRPRAR